MTSKTEKEPGRVYDEEASCFVADRGVYGDQSRLW